MQYCTTCTFPAVSATPLTFDDEGRCSGCRAALHKDRINWDERRGWFLELVNEYRSERNYDCIIPVSGGKDSYFAAHLAREFKLKALLVTYHSSTYLSQGQRNLDRMRDVFGFDHLIHYPAVDTLRKLHTVGFRKTGDMNWHNHAGIFTFPMQIALKYRVPLVLWGDHGFTEQGGMYSHNDFFEYTAKDRYEHAQHGYDWFDFEGDMGLTRNDLLPYIYPEDEEMMAVGVRGIFLSNYFYYNGNLHARIAQEQYGWQPYPGRFDRTYRKISNVDDIFENGVHDYLKFVKIGYGRGTDHSCYDIRLGLMSRAEGIEMVRKYDSVKPSDLQTWLDFVGMSEEEFDAVADTFRDRRVWRAENGEWVKDNIWGGSSAYGPVKGYPVWLKESGNE